MFRRPIYHFCVRNILAVSNVRHSGSCRKPPRCPSPCNPHPYCCSRCGPPEPSIKWCPCASKCKAIPPNPCCPVYPKGNYKLYKYVFLFGSLPTIVFQMSRVYSAAGQHGSHMKQPCRDFEYMRRRTKKFPWGEQSLFHNEDANHLPGECTKQPQPQMCK